MNNKAESPKMTAIYEAVLCLLDSGADMSAVKVQQIAEAAGIGKGTVYEYFASKEEILEGLRDYCLQNEVQRLAQCLAPCQTLEGMLDALTGYLGDVLRTRMAAYRILMRTLGGQTGTLHPDANAVFVLFAGTVQRLQAVGEIPAELSMEFCVYALVSASAGCLVASCPQVGGAAQTDMLQNARLLMLRALRP